MIQAEKRTLEWMEKNMPLIAILIVFLFGIVIRLSFSSVVSSDYNGFLLPWYNEISEHGLVKQVGDYNFLYQFLIWVLTKLHADPLSSYKLISCFFDFVLAAAAGMIVYRDSDDDGKWGFVLTFGAVWMSPIVFLNSAAWAQCDSIYSAFAILSVFFLSKEKFTTAFLLLGVSFTFKLHAVFILPFFLYVYFAKKKFSVFYFALIPLVMCVLSLPMLFWGRNISEIFDVYVNQTSSYQAMALNYPSPWLLLCHAASAEEYALFKKPAIAITVFALANYMIWWSRKSFKAEGKNFYIMAFVLTYTCVMFLPSMHERYGYLYEILAIILAVLIPKTIPLCIGLLALSLNTYGLFLWNVPSQLTVLACVNLILYFAYIAVLKRELTAEKPICES